MNPRIQSGSNTELPTEANSHSPFVELAPPAELLLALSWLPFFLHYPNIYIPPEEINRLQEMFFPMPSLIQGGSLLESPESWASSLIKAMSCARREPSSISYAVWDRRPDLQRYFAGCEENSDWIKYPHPLSPKEAATNFMVALHYRRPIIVTDIWNIWQKNNFYENIVSKLDFGDQINLYEYIVVYTVSMTSSAKHRQYISYFDNIRELKRYRDDRTTLLSVKAEEEIKNILNERIEVLEAEQSESRFDPFIEELDLQLHQEQKMPSIDLYPCLKTDFLSPPSPNQTAYAGPSKLGIYGKRGREAEKAVDPDHQDKRQKNLPQISSCKKK